MYISLTIEKNIFYYPSQFQTETDRKLDNKIIGYFKFFSDFQAESSSSTFKFRISFSNTQHQMTCKDFQAWDKKRM